MATSTKPQAGAKIKNEISAENLETMELHLLRDLARKEATDFAHNAKQAKGDETYGTLAHSVVACLYFGKEDFISDYCGIASQFKNTLVRNPRLNILLKDEMGAYYYDKLLDMVNRLGNFSEAVADEPVSKAEVDAEFADYVSTDDPHSRVELIRIIEAYRKRSQILADHGVDMVPSRKY